MLDPESYVIDHFVHQIKVWILDPETAENTSLAATGALAHRLQRRTACNAAPPARGTQNGRRGLERSLPLGFWAF